MAQAPTQIRITAKQPSGIFDQDAEPKFPHTGPVLDESIADYIESRAREEPKASSIMLDIAVEGPPSVASVEDQVRQDLRRYYDSELNLAKLDERVNRVEGIGSFTHTLPMLLGAGVIALIIYVLTAVMIPQSVIIAFLVAFSYLALITVVWVLFWDPFEKVVFDAFMLRSRTHALEKLTRADVRFSYSTGPGGTKVA